MRPFRFHLGPLFQYLGNGPSGPFLRLSAMPVSAGPRLVGAFEFAQLNVAASYCIIQRLLRP